MKNPINKDEQFSYIDNIHRVYFNGTEKRFHRTITKDQQEIISKLKKNKEKKIEMQSLLACYELNNYVFISHNSINIATSDLARLIFLSSYANYNEGLIVYDNGVQVKEKDLADFLSVSQVTANRFKKKLTSLGVLSLKNGSIYVSKEFVFKGKRSRNEKHFSRMFNNSIRDLYLNSNPSSLALIYKILPFIGFWHNVLCTNPNDKEGTPIEPFGWYDLCRILDIKNPNELKKKLKEYSFSNDEPILKTGTIGDKKMIYVNPRIVFMNNDSDLFKMAYSIFSIGEQHQSSEYLPTL